ncbi:MAG: hypothetical protein H7X76_04405 [Prolixibacteraceae bacterium]|nr:hypothetical protein [Burkholderiales bacterium]
MKWNYTTSGDYDGNDTAISPQFDCLAMKEKAQARLQEPDTKMHRFLPKDLLIEFLQAL